MKHGPALVRLTDALLSDLVVDVLSAAGHTVVACGQDTPVEAEAARIGASIVVMDALEPLAGLERSVVSVLAAGARVLLVADGASRDRVLAALFAGAAGQVVLRETTPRQLVQAVERVTAGSAELHPDVAAAVLQQWRASRQPKPVNRTVSLSAREVELLRLAAQGLTNRSIATRLDLSLKTVENHKGRIFSRLGVRNQAEAVSRAAELGLLDDLPDP